MNMNGKIIEVEWWDACLEEATVPTNLPDLDPLKRRNVGFCICDDKEKITLTYGIIENLYKGEHAHDMRFSIPKGSITSVRELK